MYLFPRAKSYESFYYLNRVVANVKICSILKEHEMDLIPEQCCDGSILTGRTLGTRSERALRGSRRAHLPVINKGFRIVNRERHSNVTNNSHYKANKGKKLTQKYSRPSQVPMLQGSQWLLLMRFSHSEIHIVMSI